MLQSQRKFARGLGVGFGAVGFLVWFSVAAWFQGYLGRVAADESSPLIGRWDVTVQGKAGAYPSWFEVTLSGYRTLVGRYVGQFGSARPISKVEVASDGSFKFVVPPQWEKRETDVTYQGHFEGDVLRGETTDDTGAKITWEARRAPSLNREATETAKPAVSLFNKTDLTGWKPRHAGLKQGWKVADGLLVNAEPGNDLMTDRLFQDFQLKAEFRYPRGSNSGIYLRGRYEVQIEDNFGNEPESHGIGGVYGYLTPSVNPSKKAGEWQNVEITLVGRKVTVVLNGERIIDRQTIPGVTGGALDSDEAKPGPILIQGDHGKVEFRSLSITTLGD